MDMYNRAKDMYNRGKDVYNKYKNMYNAAIKVKGIVTDSDSQWQEALKFLKQQNPDGVYVRLNPGPGAGIGDLGKFLFQCFENEQPNE